MESSLLKHQETAHTRNLYLASAIAMLPVFTFGALLAYISMGVPQLLSPNSTGIIIDIYEASWLVSLIQPTQMFGTLITGIIQDITGRKKCLIFCCICQTVSCLLLYCSSSYLTLLLAVCFTGISTGLPSNASYSILSEMSLIRLRGSLGSLNTLNGASGYMYIMLMSIAVPVHALSLAVMVPAIIFLCVCFILPESPMWLARQGREGEARTVLQWLRGREYSIEPELKDMEAVLSEEMGTKQEDGSQPRMLRDRTFMLPLVIVCSLFTIQAVSGADTMSFYAITIFSGMGMQPITVAIIFQAAVMLGYLISPFVMVRVNTRPQLFLSLVIMAVAQVCLSVTILVPSFSFLSVPFSMIAGLSYGMGAGPVPCVLMSTLFPQKYRSLGVSAGQMTRALMVCLQLKVFPNLMTLIGIEGIFFTHSVFLVVGAVFVFLAVPETRNKSQYELERIFSRKFLGGEMGRV